MKESKGNPLFAIGCCMFMVGLLILGLLGCCLLMGGGTQ